LLCPIAFLFLFVFVLSDYRRLGGVSVGVDDPRLGVSLGQRLVDEVVNFADQLRSELNPFGEEGHYAVAAVFQFVVVV
jgi:hypothetical protein